MAERAEGLAFRELIEEQLGAVVAHFTLTRVPEGGAPEDIKEEWLGVPLPVRSKALEAASGTQVYFDRLTGDLVENPDAIPVQAFDAIVALRTADRTHAARYWASVAPIFSELVFRGHEGDLVGVNPAREA